MGTSHVASLAGWTAGTPTFGLHPDGSEIDGKFDPAADLEPPTAPAGLIEAALDARYGLGMGDKLVAPGASHSTVDLTPLYVAHGWPLPVTDEDREDVARVRGGVDWAIKAIAALGGGGTPSIVVPHGAKPLVKVLAGDFSAILAKVQAGG